MASTTSSPTVLVTGATGTVGSEVVRHLTTHGVRVRALTRSPEKVDLPEGVSAVAGELTELDTMRAALEGADGLFLLSPVALDELPGTLLALDLARTLGTGHIVYLSVIHADRFTDPPHFAAKAAGERMIAESGLPATVLRPGYYMQNDLGLRDRLERDGVYDPPLGNAGVLAVDTRDLGEVGAAAMLDRFAHGGPVETLDVVAPETLSGPSIAAVWGDLLNRGVVHGGDDLDGAEDGMRAMMPPWMAHEMRLMYARFQRDGMVAAPGTDDRLSGLLGRPMRSYRDFAAEALSDWRR